MESISQAIRFYKDAAGLLARCPDTDGSSPTSSYARIMQESPLLFELLCLLMEKYNSFGPKNISDKAISGPRQSMKSPTALSVFSFSNEKSQTLHQLGRTNSVHSTVFRSVPHCQIRSLEEEEFNVPTVKLSKAKTTPVYSSPSEDGGESANNVGTTKTHRLSWESDHQGDMPRRLNAITFGVAAVSSKSSVDSDAI
jgi:hypothetical protein